MKKFIAGDEVVRIIKNNGHFYSRVGDEALVVKVLKHNCIQVMVTSGHTAGNAEVWRIEFAQLKNPRKELSLSELIDVAEDIDDIKYILRKMTGAI